MARSFDGGYFGSQEGPMRPEMRPGQHWSGWQDNRGCYVALHGTHGMPPGQDVPQLYSQANGFYLGSYGHSMSQPYSHHAPVSHMPQAYTIVQEQHVVRSTPTSPHKTPKLESPGPEVFNHVHEAMDENGVSTHFRLEVRELSSPANLEQFAASIDNTGIPSTC